MTTQTKWILYHPSIDDDDYHVIPCFGRGHDMSDDCWCHPDRDGKHAEIVIHNAEQ